MIRIPTHREPTHPGEMLLEEFLIPMGITQRDLANAIHVPYQRVNEIVNQKRGITPSTALRLAKFFGMAPDFWMNLQLRWDLYHAQADEKRVLDTIRPFPSEEKAGWPAKRGAPGANRWRSWSPWGRSTGRSAWSRCRPCRSPG